MDGKKPDSPGGSSTAGGQDGEKVKNVEVLLEVFQKMDKLEQDADKKAMIQSMVDTAKKYLDALKGMDKKGPAGAPPTGEAGSGGGMGAGDAGAAGAGAGAGGSGPMGGGTPGMA